MLAVKTAIAKNEGSKAIVVQKGSVETDVLEVIVLVVVTDWLDKWQCLLHLVATAEFHLSHHVDLQQ